MDINPRTGPSESLIRDLETNVVYDDPEGAMAKCNRAGVYGYNAWLAWCAAKVSVAMQQRSFTSTDDIPATQKSG